MRIKGVNICIHEFAYTPGCRCKYCTGARAKHASIYIYIYVRKYNPALRNGANRTELRPYRKIKKNSRFTPSHKFPPLFLLLFVYFIFLFLFCIPVIIFVFAPMTTQNGQIQCTQYYNNAENPLLIL